MGDLFQYLLGVSLNSGLVYTLNIIGWILLIVLPLLLCVELGANSETRLKMLTFEHVSKVTRQHSASGQTIGALSAVCCHTYT